MIPYILLLVASVGGLFILENPQVHISNRERNIKWYMIGVAMVMVCMGGLRAVSVGADTATYHEYFTTDFYYKIEFGYIYLSRLINYLGLHFNILLLLVQAFITIPILYIIYKYGKIRWLSLFMYQAFYLYVNSYNILRQSMAMTIVLIAVTYLLKSSSKKHTGLVFFLLILIAVLFHTSAIMLIALLPLRNHTANAKKILGILLISVLIMIFRNSILTFLFSLINRGYYTEFPIDLGASSVVLFILFLTIAVDYKVGINESYKNNKFIFNLLIYGLFFNVIWAWFPNHARITMYLFLILSIYLPNVLVEIKDHKEKLLKIVVLVVFMLALYGFQLSLRDYGKVVPYVMTRIF